MIAMIDRSAIVFSCDSWQLMFRTLKQIKHDMPIEMRKQLNTAFLGFCALEGHEKAWQRMNGRTIQGILDDYEVSEKPVPICSGELNGVKYRLYDAPKANSNDAP